MSKNATKNMEENRCFICFQFKEWVKLLNLNQFRSIKSCEINLYLLSRDKLFQSSLIFLNLILIFNEGIFWKFKGWVLHFYFKLWKIIVNMILQKYSALQTYFFKKKSCGFGNLMRRFSILHYYFIIYCRNPQVHPQRLGLQRRLYWIYLGYFLKFLVLCNCKLMSILFRSFNISFNL